MRTSRRELLMATTGAFAFGPAFLRDALARPACPGRGPYGDLSKPDANGLMLPDGFTSRLIARGGRPVGGYPWHFACDGQATYRTKAGGWVLVSNSEAPGALGGGASAIRFTPTGEIERAYRILAGTNLNCAGGPTPWGTWLSGEEHPGGLIWEADPAGVLPAQPRPALGNFAHEAAAVDPVHRHVFLTEDVGDGCFYRFTPDVYPSLLQGVLEVAVVGEDGRVEWRRVPDPNVVAQAKETRHQVPGATRFNGGEGLWYDQGTVYFTTKGDRRVWAYDTRARRLDVVYDRALTPDASLDAVDNVCVSASGDVFVCEDGGNMEIGIISRERTVSPFLRLTGPEHAGSEMVGVVFDPSGTRMYFGSQRAHPHVGGTPAADGAIFEVSGPFRLPRGGVPADKVYGPPAGETGTTLPSAAQVPGLRIDQVRGLRVRVTLDEPGTVQAVLRTPELQSLRFRRWAEPRPIQTTLATLAPNRLSAGTHELRLDGRTATVRSLLQVTASGGRSAALVLGQPSTVPS